MEAGQGSREHQQQLQNVGGTINMFAILPDRIEIAVDSLSTFLAKEGDATYCVWSSDNVHKFKVVVDPDPSAGIPGVIVTACGNGQRNYDLWSHLGMEKKNMSSMDDVVQKVLQFLMPTTPLEMYSKCELFVAGYNTSINAYQVVHIEDGVGIVRSWSSPFDYGAIGSGAEFGYEILHPWFANWNNHQLPTDELANNVFEQLMMGMVNAYIFDPACGGKLRVLTINLESIEREGRRPLPLFQMSRLSYYSESSLFFMSTHPYRSLNYFMLDKYLSTAGWLPQRRGKQGEAPYPSCLGMFELVRLFAVRFEFGLRAREFFDKAKPIAGDNYIRVARLTSKINVFVCEVDYDLLGKIIRKEHCLPYHEI